MGQFGRPIIRAYCVNGECFKCMASNCNHDCGHKSRLQMAPQGVPGAVHAEAQNLKEELRTGKPAGSRKQFSQGRGKKKEKV